MSARSLVTLLVVENVIHELERKSVLSCFSFRQRGAGNDVSWSPPFGGLIIREQSPGQNELPLEGLHLPDVDTITLTTKRMDGHDNAVECTLEKGPGAPMILVKEEKLQLVSYFFDDMGLQM